jgi:hypothetical protein
MHELILDCITGINVHHVINEQAMDDVLRSTAFHENCLLTIHSRISISFHPARYAGPAPRSKEELEIVNPPFMFLAFDALRKH